MSDTPRIDYQSAHRHVPMGGFRFWVEIESVTHY
jgi:hypothetical protein